MGEDVGRACGLAITASAEPVRGTLKCERELPVLVLSKTVKCTIHICSEWEQVTANKSSLLYLHWFCQKTHRKRIGGVVRGCFCPPSQQSPGTQTFLLGWILQVDNFQKTPWANAIMSQLRDDISVKVSTEGTSNDSPMVFLGMRFAEWIRSRSSLCRLLLSRTAKRSS